MNPEIYEIISILNKQIIEPIHVNEEQFTILDVNLQKLISDEENINDNFTGTIEEISAYVSQRVESKTLTEHACLNELNIKRWIKELQLLNNGGGAVTIDYEQRKGREI